MPPMHFLRCSRRPAPNNISKLRKLMWRDSRETHTKDAIKPVLA